MIPCENFCRNYFIYFTLQNSNFSYWNCWIRVYWIQMLEKILYCWRLVMWRYCIRKNDNVNFVTPFCQLKLVSDSWMKMERFFFFRDNYQNDTGSSLCEWYRSVTLKVKKSKLLLGKQICHTSICQILFKLTAHFRRNYFFSL